MATKQQTTDYTKMMQEMMASMPFDASAMQGSMKNYAQFGERFSKVALDAAEKSVEIQTSWTKSTLERMHNIAAVRDEPSDYGKAMTDFASAQTEMTAETMAQFAEVAKRVQMDTVELMLSAGKDMSEDLTTAAQKASSEASSAAKRTTAAAK